MRASTSDAGRSWPRRLALLVVGALALAGCIAATRHDDQETSHFRHLGHVSRGLGCSDCHAGTSADGAMALPALETCAQCHNAQEPVPADVAAEISAYAVRLAAAVSARPASYADVRFAHAAHVGSAQLSCAVCHGTLSAAQPEPAEPLAMNACVSCHRERSQPVSCETCHSTWALTYRPPSHLALWDVRHGLASGAAPRDKTVASAENCALCHARSSCDQCHAQEKPKNHTEAWRTATHGLAAAMDRSRCVACHAADSCERCHLGSPPPTSHRAGFGGPRDLHCLGCHEQLSQSACSVCHKGTPDHNLAAPKPANHTAGLNCRQCHGHGQALPHVDNGSDCNSCHH